MTRKFALLIGNSLYEDPTLAKLKAPDSDVSELAKILKDPVIGGFDQVMVCLSESSTKMKIAISDFFDNKQKGDLLFLYFSGHGVLDRHGHLYLAVKDTQYNRLNATGIPDSFVKDEMESCRSKRQVLVLDCCYSGAFARTKGSTGQSAITPATLEGIGGYGQVVITATKATQFAFEGDQILGSVETSLFTHFLIEGLRSGEADADRDGRITLDELYEYVYEQVCTHTPDQTPLKWEDAREGKKIVIAHSHYTPADPLLDLREAIDSTIPNIRVGAVRELGQLLRENDKSLVRSARGILRVMAQEDANQQVRLLASTILKEHEDTRTAKPSALESKLPSLPPHPKAGPADIGSTPPTPKWFLWAGISIVILVCIGAYLLGNFVGNPFKPPPSYTPISSLAASTASTQTFISLTTNVPLVLATGTQALPTQTSVLTDTPILPTATLVLPTSTLVPTIGVPINPPTYTPTPIPVLPTFTPTSGGTSKIVFASDQNGNSEIYLMNSDGSGLINLTNNSAIDSQPSWSPDGRRIAFSSTRGDPNPGACDGQCNWGVYVMNAEGSNVIQLMNNGGGPSWSPDGRKIVFYAGLVGDPNSEEIYVMNADGSGQIRLTQNSMPDFDPSWSPDGTKIAFCSSQDGNAEIYVMNADGSGLINLTNNSTFDYYPRWSPDGRKITFVSYRDGNLEIYVMNADGTGQIRLTQNSDVDHYSSWSPDGTKLVFYSKRNGNPGIYVMNADGSGLIKLTNYSASDPYPDWSP